MPDIVDEWVQPEPLKKETYFGENGTPLRYFIKIREKTFHPQKGSEHTLVGDVDYDFTISDKDVDLVKEAKTDTIEGCDPTKIPDATEKECKEKYYIVDKRRYEDLNWDCKIDDADVELVKENVGLKRPYTLNSAIYVRDINRVYHAKYWAHCGYCDILAPDRSEDAYLDWHGREYPTPKGIIFSSTFPIATSEIHVWNVFLKVVNPTMEDCLTHSNWVHFDAKSCMTSRISFNYIIFISTGIVINFTEREETLVGSYEFLLEWTGNNKLLGSAQLDTFDNVSALFDYYTSDGKTISDADFEVAKIDYENCVISFKELCALNYIHHCQPNLGEIIKIKEKRDNRYFHFPTIIYKNEDTEILAIFRNTGYRFSIFYARLVITDPDGNEIKTESEGIELGRNEECLQPFIVKPDKEGKYEVKLELLADYNNKEQLCDECESFVISSVLKCYEETTHFKSGRELLLNFDENNDGVIDMDELLKANRAKIEKEITEEEFKLVEACYSGGSIEDTCPSRVTKSDIETLTIKAT